MKDNLIAIAIDGPAAAGKSTVAKIVANKLSYIYIDTGAMYRTLTLHALEKNIDVHDENKLAKLLIQSDIQLEHKNDGQHVFLNGKDVTFEIRSEKVSNTVSYVAEHPKVRKEMLKRQQHFAKERGVVMDGRDIGTHVIPDAEVKIFLVATAEERARRRHEENIAKGIASDLETLKKEIEQRDQIDMKRHIAPLVKAEDAIEIDTTHLTIIEVAECILKYAKQAIRSGES
ncbi:MAG TPA: (d)CMP kinase [Bacillota bacterium]|nr:(d)CMP kinase [Bacillota bacterium]